jgi:phenylalanyl-tRNA synthetase beta chain
MKFPLAWIAEYVDMPSDEEAVAKAYTFSGSEVEGRESLEGETVFDFNITVNRPDAMNIYGLAREASILMGTPLRDAETACEETGPPVADITSIEVEAPDLCPRYVARVITGVKVGQSPGWMQKRLVQCGLRPINAVVDATNYVLLELGHPLHAFDMDTLTERRIVVRRARKGEKLVTLDGVERVLGEEHLVIADAKKPVAIAGVMGGEETGVTSSTTDVLLEGAVFDAVSVRRTSKAFGMHTDASHRFERGVDPEGPIAALDRVARLIVQTCGGRLAGGRIDVLNGPAVPVTVRLRHRRVVDLLGIDIPPERCEEILASLGFRHEAEEQGTWLVTVPSFRVDVSREADLIEEIMRINGLHDLAPDLPSGVDPVGGRPRFLGLEESLRNALAASGCTETIHMSMADPDLARIVEPSAAPLLLANPLAPASSALRTSLLAPLLACVAKNRARGIRRLSLFEIGKVYLGANPVGVREERRAAALIYEDEPAPQWGAPASADLIHLKGKLEAAMRAVGIDPRFEAAERVPFLPGQCLAVVAGDRVVGHAGTLSPSILDAAGIKSGTLHFAEFSLEGFEKMAAEPRFLAFSRFPAAVRDFSFLADKSVRWGDLESRLEGLDLPELAEIRLVECYEGKGIPAGKRSWTFSLVFQSQVRTLNEDDIAPVAQRVAGALQEAFGAVLR